MCHHGVAGRMFNTFQRRLIYYPTREPRIEPQDVDLPAGHVHTVVLTTDDGLELRGWHILPGGRLAVDRKACNQILEAGGRVVLFFSGNAANRRLRAAEFLVLAALGLHVFIFDYRGYGDNPGEPSEERLADDAHSMWEYLVFERHLSPDRILLYGESLGGAWRFAWQTIWARAAFRLRGCYSDQPSRRWSMLRVITFPGCRCGCASSTVIRPSATSPVWCAPFCNSMVDETPSHHLNMVDDCLIKHLMSQAPALPSSLSSCRRRGITTSCWLPSKSLRVGSHTFFANWTRGNNQ
jgi:hypothetical protein